MLFCCQPAHTALWFFVIMSQRKLQYVISRVCSFKAISREKISPTNFHYSKKMYWHMQKEKYHVRTLKSISSILQGCEMHCVDVAKEIVAFLKLSM